MARSLLAATPTLPMPLVPSEDQPPRERELSNVARSLLAATPTLPMPTVAVPEEPKVNLWWSRIVGALANICLGIASVLVVQEAKHLVTLGANGVVSVSLTGISSEGCGLVAAVVWCWILSSRTPDFTWLPQSWGETGALAGRTSFGYLQGVLSQAGSLAGAVAPGVVICAGSLGAVFWAVGEAFSNPGKRIWRLSMVAASVVCVVGVWVASLDSFLGIRNLALVAFPLVIGLALSVTYAFIQMFARQLGAETGYKQPVAKTQLYVGIVATAVNVLMTLVAVARGGAWPSLDPIEILRLLAVGALFIGGCYLLTAANRVKRGKSSGTELQMIATLQVICAFLVDSWFGYAYTLHKIGGTAIVVATVILAVGWISPRTLADRQRARVHWKKDFLCQGLKAHQ